MQKGKEYVAGQIRFPLVELGLNREQAIAVVEEIGWPTPPRSRCWCCPNQSDLEWADVNDTFPELMDEAIKLDEEVRLRDPHAYLHNTVEPLRFGIFKSKEDVFSSGCKDGVCFL